MGLQVRSAVAAEDLAACYAVRMTVFVEEQHVPPEEELDADDGRAEHFLAEEDGRAVGTARLLDKGREGKIGRVAVLADRRGRGVGRALMLHLMNHARGRFEELVLDAQVPVIPFYEALGFEAEGEVFMDAGIPHRRMRRGG